MRKIIIYTSYQTLKYKKGEKMNDSIMYKEGKKNGKTVAIFAGVHGNEIDCIRVMDYLIENLKVESGKVYLVYANPGAIKVKKRYIEKNLNRCFFPDNKAQTIEDKRAQELMKILDECEALLDLHQYNEKEGNPFIICEENALKVVAYMDVEIVSTGWSTAEPGGTDYYMFIHNKPGICLESGPLGKPDESYNTALESAYRFIEFYGLIEKWSNFRNLKKQKIINVKYAVTKKTNDFKFIKIFKSFESLTPGKLFAEDGKDKYYAKEGQCIIFPRPEASIGSEAFIIGEIIE